MKNNAAFFSCGSSSAFRPNANDATKRCRGAKNRFLQTRHAYSILKTAAEEAENLYQVYTCTKEETAMDFGEKLKSARKQAGLTQGQLAEKLAVSRQAITKWESGSGMPEIGNLKQLSRLLNVSIDYLLDEGEHIDLSVTREPIDLEAYHYDRKLKGRWAEKVGKKDMIVRAKYPDGEIHGVIGRQIPTKSERVVDNLIGWLSWLPFGIPDGLNAMKNRDKEFYLVSQQQKQFFVVVTDEFIESRQLGEKITKEKFVIGNWSFMDCGLIHESEKK